MFELRYISETEYNSALLEVDNGLNFKKGLIENSSKNTLYSYHTDGLLNQIIEDICNKKNISKEFAINYIEMSGLKIYSTQNQAIQATIEEELANPKYIIRSEKDPSITAQAAMVVLDHTNGYVLGCVRWNWKKRNSSWIK